MPVSDRAQEVAGGFISFDMKLWRPCGQISYSAGTPVRSVLTLLVPNSDQAQNSKSIVPVSDRAQEVAGGFVSFVMILWRPHGQIPYSVGTPVRSGYRSNPVLGGDAGTIMKRYDHYELNKKTAYLAVGVVCLLGSLTEASFLAVSEGDLAPLPPSAASLWPYC